MTAFAVTQKGHKLFLGLCLLIGLLVSPMEQARSDSIVTDGDIIGDGVSLLELMDLHCQHLDEVHALAALPPACVLGAGERFVFATSTTSTAGGNIVQWANNLLIPATFTEGLAAGDAICQKHADAAGLPGTYKAWLSTGTVNAKDRIGDHTYVRRNGDTVASSKAELLSCIFQGSSCLQNHIITELDNPTTNKMWTGTWEDGTNDRNGFAAPAHCSDWTEEVAGSEDGISSNPIKTDWRWTAEDSYPCSNSHGLYCFQQ